MSIARKAESVRYPATETAEKHERILNAAAKLFRERGFSGVGVAEIMQAAGLTHGAFYAHFESKDALAAEALVRAFAQSDDNIYAATANAAEPKQAFLEGYLSARHRDRPGTGCALAALGAEIARDTAMRAPFTEQVKRMIARMAKRFGWKNQGLRAPERDPSAVGGPRRADPGTRGGRSPRSRTRSWPAYARASLRHESRGDRSDYRQTTAPAPSARGG